jgi:uncharacterized membrane protein
METAKIILQFLHFMGLVLGMGSGLALSQVGPAITGGTPDQRTALWGLQEKLSRAAHSGLGLLLITGLFLVGLKSGGLAGVNMWFWAKMGLVVVLVVSVGVGSSAAKRLKGGDVSAAPVVKRAGMINGLTGMAIVLLAVIAFR